ncbi:NACHT domain-containing protein [Streptomyces venezuelae]|nr:NACHT domain-containing protein [Streptomyces venezuelae]
MGARQVRGPARWLFLGGAATLAVSGAWAVWAVRRDGMQPQDVAGVLGLPLGVLGLLVGTAISLSALRLQRASDGLGVALDRLAGSVEDVEVAERTHMLGTGAHLIDLHVDVEPRGGGAAPRGRQRLSDVARWYCDAPDRLVVTGPPGAGKTVLAVHLVVRLLEARAAGSPVPVRLSIRDLTPVGRRRWWGLRRARGGLEQWLVSSLVKSYDVDGVAAVELVARRLVIPVLDGLDEMDTEGDSGRARQALSELNGYQGLGGSAPLVLTCREERYTELAERQAWLREATLLRIAGVDADQAGAYVELRSDGRSSPVGAVAPAMRRDAAGPVAVVLSSPFYLGLAVAVYGGSPDGLRPLPDFGSEDDLRYYLLARCVPTATAAANAAARQARASVMGSRTPWIRQPDHDPGAVHRWLHHMAGAEGGIASAGRVLGRGCTTVLALIAALVPVVFVLLALPDAVAQYFPESWWQHRVGSGESWAYAVLFVSVTALVWSEGQRERRPSRPSEQVRQRPGGVGNTAARVARRAGVVVALACAPVIAVGSEAMIPFTDWYAEIPSPVWYASGLVTVLVVAGAIAVDEDVVAHSDVREGIGCAALPTVCGLAAFVIREVDSPAGDFACTASLLGAVILLRRFGCLRAYSLIGGLLGWALTWEPVYLGPAGSFSAGGAAGILTSYALGCALLGSGSAERTREAARGVARSVRWLLPLGIVVGPLLIGMGATVYIGFAGVVFLAIAWMTLILIEPLAHALLTLTAHLLGRTPLTPDTFLAWAYHAGLLRIVGGAYQFRHSELQEWLHRNPVPPANR